MTDRDDMPAFAASDVAAALGLLTRLPVPVDGARATARGARAVWAYPVVGLVVGLGLALLCWGLRALDLPAPAVAALVLAAGAVLTGALHEDGLADCADGFWGGYDPARRLEIMRDSRIGAYGVLALVFSVLVRWAALAPLVATGHGTLALIVAATLSRWAMSVPMAALPPARPDGLSRRVGRPGALPVLVGGAFAGMVVLIAVPGAAVLLAVLTGLAIGGCAWLAQRKIGGQTGDVLGATQQLTEAVTLLTLAAYLT